MTVTANDRKIVYTGNDVASVFAYDFKIFVDTEVKVVERIIATGVETTLTISTDYTVTGTGEDSGGNVTLVAGAFPSTKKLILTGNTPQTQSFDLVENDSAPASGYENAYDKGVILSQQQKTQIDRCLKMDDTTSTDTQLPTPSDGKSIKYDLATDAWVNTDNDPDEQATLAAASAAAAAVSASAASTSASNASASESAASTSETNASNSAIAAAASAAEITSLLPTITGKAEQIISVNAAGTAYEVGEDVLIPLGKEMRYGDSAVKISSETDGQLDLDADVSIDFSIGGVEQIELVDGVLQPTTDNDVDLGASGAEFKDLWIDGTANIDTLTIGASTAVTQTAEGVGDNDQLATKGYVDDNVGAGDVTAAVNIADNAVVKGDGGAKGVQGEADMTLLDAGLFNGPDGAVGAVTYGFTTGAGNDGMYLQAADDVRIAAAGNITMTYNSTTSTIFSSFGPNGAGALSNGSAGDYWLVVNAKDFTDRSGIFVSDKNKSYNMFKNLEKETGLGHCRLLEDKGKARVKFSKIKEEDADLIDDALEVAEEDIYFDENTVIDHQVGYDTFQIGDKIATKGQLTRWLVRKPHQIKNPKDGKKHIIQTAEGISITGYISHLSGAIRQLIEKVEELEARV